MQITHIIHSLDRRSGGPSHAIRKMVQAQVNAGLDASIVATNAQSAEPWLGDIEYRRQLREDPELASIRFSVARAYGRKRPWSRYSWSPEARRMLRTEFSGARRPHVVHVHGVFSHISETACREAARAGIPFIIRPAGCLDAGCRQRGSARLKSLFIKAFLNRSIRQAALIHATSEKEAEAIREFAPHARIEVIPHGTEFHDPTGGDLRGQLPDWGDRQIILSLSRIHPIKRLDIALRAFAVHAATEDLGLVVVGNDAGALPGLKTLAVELGVADRVCFPGFLSGAHKAAAYAEARLFLHTSEHENFGLSVVEAMAAGCPVVTTKGVAAGRYVAESGGGRVVDMTVEAVAAAMAELLAEDKPVCGERGREFAWDNLTWPVITHRMASIYSELAPDHRTVEASTAPVPESCEPLGSGNTDD